MPDADIFDEVLFIPSFLQNELAITKVLAVWHSIPFTKRRGGKKPKENASFLVKLAAIWRKYSIDYEEISFLTKLPDDIVHIAIVRIKQLGYALPNELHPGVREFLVSAKRDNKKHP